MISFAILLFYLQAVSPLHLGNFVTRYHDVAGSVTIMSDRIVQIDNFVYDGTGPDAFVWIDNQPEPENDSGTILQDVGGSCGAERLRGYSNETLIVELPEGSRVQDYAGGSISVWCRAVSLNFGEVLIPENVTEEAIPATEVCNLQCKKQRLRRGM